ncbi:hypothetical protein [Vermiculatibacterium agrestimuris]|uniref:hypothetical protein n=1 Tax=Vermiculatibacterium agrestimuris TaxID=2941519 RepID=UPI00203E113C|nr:hypothetical protein [Vermiculatibacterium agrestimuris]
MIPRPLTDNAARHNPGRWVCNIRPERCNGIFRVYGQDMPCPLRDKCLAGRRNTYQWTPGHKLAGRYPEMDLDADWHRHHGTRLAQLQQAFAPLLRRKQRTPEQRKLHAEWQREARRRQQVDGHAAPPLRRVPLPCGEDCENCPYDACPYTDEDLDAIEAVAARQRAHRSYDPQRRRAKYERDKLRRANDPKSAERFRAQNAARCKRWYQKNRAKRKENQK